jgi:hypothetical protein
MAINASLPVSGLINVTASLAAAAVQGQSTTNMLVLGSSNVINPVTRIQTYTSAAAVTAAGFPPTSPEALFADVWFAQSPTPPRLKVGRWVQSASSAQLVGAPLSATQQLIATWQAITNGGFDITIDGTAKTLTALNFSGASNLNAVAAIVQADLTGATFIWNSVNSTFVVTSNTTGTTSSVSFATTGSGTDISAMLGLTAGSSGVVQASPGLVAESAATAVTLFDANYGGQWYGIDVLGAADSDIEAIVPIIAGSANKHFFFPTTQEAGVLVAATTTDIASVLQASNSTKVAVQYSGQTPYASAALSAIMLGVDYTGSNTVKAAMWQVLADVAGDSISPTQLTALLGKNANGFLNYNNGASIVQPGICSNGQYIDTVIGADALALAIQTAVFNLFLTQTVPQTDGGNHLIKVAIQNVLQQFVNNGYIAPGVWNGPPFGGLQANADGTAPTLSTGYYVYQPPIASQNAAQRNARISVPFQIAVNLAGAVQTVSVAILLAN